MKQSIVFRFLLVLCGLKCIPKLVARVCLSHARIAQRNYRPIIIISIMCNTVASFQFLVR